VLNVSNNCGLTSRKTTSKTPKTNNFSTLTKRWQRFSEMTAFVPSVWPSSSPLTCLKLIGRVFLHTLIHGSKNDRIKAWPLRLPESILHHPQIKQSQIKKGMIFEMNKTHYVPQEFLPSGVLAIISGRRIVQKIIYYRFFLFTIICLDSHLYS